MTKKALLIAAAIMIIAAAFIPFPTRITQPLKVQFTVRDSQPIAGVRVFQDWGFYGLPDRGSYEAFTDSSGTVVLPARVAHGSAMRRLWLRAATLLFIHSSYGAYASFSVSLPPDLGVNFRSSAFSPRQVSGAAELDGRQVFLVVGDFVAGSDTIRFLLERKTPSQSP